MAIRIEPRFSEATQGASVCNCYIESGFSGKGQTRMRGRRSIAKVKKFGHWQRGEYLKHEWGEWDNTLAVHESSKTRNIYILAEKNHLVGLLVFDKDGNLDLIDEIGYDYDRKMKCNFAETRFLNNKYVANFEDGQYGILFVVSGKLHVLDDQDPADGFQHIDEFGETKLGSVAVVANRIVVSELNGSTWWYSKAGGLGDESGCIFDLGDRFNDSEYSGDCIIRVARIAGIRLGVFGERTLEIWDVTDNKDDPFTTSFQGQVWKIGCIEESLAEINDVVYFAGIEDLSGRYSIYSIGREGLLKLSENPLDTMLTEAVKNAPDWHAICGGKYSENSANFYLLHLDAFTLAYCLPEKAFSRFYHKEGSTLNVPFNCVLPAGECVIGLRGGIMETAEGVAEYTGHFAEKMLAMPVHDGGGSGHFIVRSLTLDMSTVATPRKSPPESNIIAVDYAPDGTDTFVGRRSIAIPEAGFRKAYPLRLWGLGRCNSLKLRLLTGTLDFILDSITIETEECL